MAMSIFIPVLSGVTGMQTATPAWYATAPGCAKNEETVSPYGASALFVRRGFRHGKKRLTYEVGSDDIEAPK